MTFKPQLLNNKQHIIKMVRHCQILPFSYFLQFIHFSNSPTCKTSCRRPSNILQTHTISRLPRDSATRQQPEVPLESSGKHFNPTLWFNVTAQTSNTQMPYPLSPTFFFLTTRDLSQKEITMQIPAKVQIHKRGTTYFQGGVGFFCLFCFGYLNEGVKHFHLASTKI